jgi:arabinose-5-phosphate isomerase
VDVSASGRDVVEAITKGRQGCVAVIKPSGDFAGMITDGDLRRAMTDDFFTKTAAHIMHKNPVTARPEQRMSDLIERMTEKRISNIFVIDQGKLVGLVHMKDLMQKGYI